MKGYLTDTGDYCIALSPSKPSVLAGEAEIPMASEQSSFKIYPNPTKGNFILEFKGEVPAGKGTIDIFEMRGEKVFSAGINGERQHVFSLLDIPPGLYFIRVISGDKAETAKIIKQ